MGIIGNGSFRRNGQRVGVFFDTSNQFLAARLAFGGGNLDLRTLLAEATKGRCLIAATAYVIDDGTPSKQAYIYSLKCSGYRVRAKDLQIFPDGMRKGNWDVGLAVDAKNFAPQLDVAVLITGDGDFIDLMVDLQRSGHYVVVMSFRSNLSAALRDAADEVVLLDDRRFCYRNNGSTNGHEAQNGGTPPTENRDNEGNQPVKT